MNEPQPRKCCLYFLNVLDIELRELEIRFIREQIQSQFGDMKYLKDALGEAVQEL